MAYKCFTLKPLAITGQFFTRTQSLCELRYLMFRCTKGDPKMASGEREGSSEHMTSSLKTSPIRRPSPHSGSAQTQIRAHQQSPCVQSSTLSMSPRYVLSMDGSNHSKTFRVKTAASRRTLRSPLFYGVYYGSLNPLAKDFKKKAVKDVVHRFHITDFIRRGLRCTNPAS